MTVCHYLSPDRNAALSLLWLLLILIGFVGLVGVGLVVEEAALLDRAAGLDTGDGAMVGVLGDRTTVGAGSVGDSGGGVGVVDGGREVGDVLGNRVLGADGTSIYTIALSGLGHGIVTGIEVFAVFEMLGEVIGAGGELAIEAE